MTMSKGVLSDLIKTEIENSTVVDDETELQKLTDAIAEGVVTHIKNDAEVLVTGITSGGASAPGTVS